MISKTTPQAPTLENITKMSEQLGIPIIPDQLQQVQLHLSILTDHAINVMSYRLPEELEPAPEYKP